MEKKIIETLHRLSKKSIKPNQFKIKKINTNLPFHIKPSLTNIFRKKENRTYTIIVPIRKISEISKSSEKEIETWLKEDLATILETQNMAAFKLAGFTIQYIANKRKK